MIKLIEICPDFPEWPERWMGDEKDFEYGQKLLEVMRPFAESLANSNLTQKTIKKHLSNLWLLGGEIIRDVNMEDEYSLSAFKKLRSTVGEDGGPYSRHLNNESEIKSFDSTCRKLHNFLKNQK